MQSAWWRIGSDGLKRKVLQVQAVARKTETSESIGPIMGWGGMGGMGWDMLMAS